MNILVTGADGYIGIRLAEVLAQRNHKVTGLDTGYYRSGWLYNGISNQPAMITKDIRQITAKDLVGFDAIIHLAELSNDPLGQTNPALTVAINHKGTVRLARLAKKVGVKRFVYFSSCSVYGASENIADETSPVHPLTAYAQSKVLNEKTLNKMADDTFSPVILRNATVYGVSPRLRFDLAVNNLTGVAWTSKEIKMESDGSPWRPFVHVLDVAFAAACVVEAPKKTIHNQIFNVGDSTANYQIKDIADAISQVFPGCAISLGKNGGDKRNYRVNFDKINTLLPGFTCKKNVLDGVKELLQMFKRVGLEKETFESRHYTRLKQIQYLLQTKQLDEQLFWRK